VDDPDRPSLQFLDDSTLSVRLPSFASTYKPVIDSLLGANSQQLRATMYLIVDVRGNGGGYTGSYDSLTPLLYTDPVHFHGVDVWASPANIAHYRTMRGSTFLSATDLALIAAFLTRAERRANQFVQLTPDDVIRRDTVFPLPRRVAVLVDSGCASSCEDFVLEARQSRKVTLIGTHTAGTHDYGEVHGVWLPGWRRVALPASRVRGLRIDNVGIVPAVPIPESEADAVTFARRYLYSVRRN
jgi:C-terminal processing protease CtpA/Prc